MSEETAFPPRGNAGEQGPPNPSRPMAQPLLIFLLAMTAAIILSALLIAGLIVMSVELRNVPEGRQDETGFHYVWRNFTPDTRDIACVWATLAEVSAVSAPGEMHAAA